MRQVGDICVWYRQKRGGGRIEDKIPCRIVKIFRPDGAQISYWDDSLSKFQTVRVLLENLNPATEDEVALYRARARDYARKVESQKGLGFFSATPETRFVPKRKLRNGDPSRVTS